MFVSLFECTLPPSISKIDKGLFRKCNKMQQFEIPLQVIAICDSAFESCSSLKEMTIPPSVKSFGSSVFKGRRSLEKGLLSSSCSFYSINEEMFCGCKSLIKF